MLVDMNRFQPAGIDGDAARLRVQIAIGVARAAAADGNRRACGGAGGDHGLQLRHAGRAHHCQWQLPGIEHIGGVETAFIGVGQQAGSADNRRQFGQQAGFGAGRAGHGVSPLQYR